jgi:pectate lyase
VEKGKCVDITEGSFNVTVQGSLMGFTGQVQDLVKNKGMLIANFKYGPVGNVSLHHNLFYCDYQRSPEISTPGLFDMVNNVVFNYTEYGSRIRNGAYGNFNSNAYIGGKKDPLVFVDQNPKVYSVYNTWKYACVNWTYIDDLVTH